MRSKIWFTCLVVIGAYPLITALSYLIAPFTTDWATWQRTAILSPLMVVAMIHGLIPIIQTCCTRFITAD